MFQGCAQHRLIKIDSCVLHVPIEIFFIAAMGKVAVHELVLGEKEEHDPDRNARQRHPCR